MLFLENLAEKKITLSSKFWEIHALVIYLFETYIVVNLWEFYPMNIFSLVNPVFLRLHGNLLLDTGFVDMSYSLVKFFNSYERYSEQ